MSRSVPCLSRQCVTLFLFPPLGITISVKTVYLLNMHLLTVKWKKSTASSGKFFRLLPGIQKVSPFTYSILFLELLNFSELQVFICGLNLAKIFFFCCASAETLLSGLISFIKVVLLANFFVPSQQSIEKDTLTWPTL